MSVIIRLQNLPWSANALDIRAFFHGLSIPDGGVHIVGGEMGDAFIAFSTDEDARQAMSMDRGKLNEVQVRLLLSSRAEMQKVIESARNKSLSMQMQRSQQQQQNQQITLPTPQPPVITSTTLKHIMSNQQNQLALNPMQQYQSYSQTLNLENSQDSRDSRSDNNGDGKSRSRNRSKDRRSSTSPSRGRGDRRRSTSRSREIRRRGRDRSRSRSRSRDRKTNRRRRSRSRDRGNSDRSRWDKDSRDRNDDRKDTDKEMKKSNDKDMVIVLDKEVEQPPIPPPNSTKLNLWPPSGNPLFPPNANVMQGYTTISQNMNNLQQQQIQTPVYQTNISAGYQSANQFNSQMFPQFNKPPPIDGSFNQLDNFQQNKFPNMLNLNNPTQQGSGLNFNNLNPNNSGLQNTFNSSSFNPTGINSPQQSSADLMNSLSGGVNKLTSFSGIFSSQNKKIDENNKPINDPRIQNSPNMMMNNNKPGTNNNQNELQKNYGDINFDELRGNCIKISNMCPSTSYSDIRRFFSGLFIANNGIKMINDKHGLRIGVAYVRFVRPESKPKAFIRNGSPLKNKKILIESVTEDEFEEEIDSYKPVRRFENNRYGDDRPPPHIPLRGDIDNSSPRNTGDDTSPVDNKSQNPNNSQSKTNLSGSESIDDDDDNMDENKKDDKQQPFTILKLDDVPVFAKEYDIMKMFSSFTIIDILLAKNEDNKRFLKCYVKFHLPDDAKAALKNKSLHVIGHKQIYVNSCTEEKFNEVKEKLNQPEIIEDSIEDNNNLNNNESQNNQENLNDLSYDPYNPIIRDRFNNDDNNEFNNNNDDNNQNDKNCNFINNNNINNNNNNNRNNNNQPPSLLNLPPLGRLDSNLDPRRRDKPSRFNNNSNNSSDNKIMNKNMKRFVLLKNCEFKLTKRDYAEFFATIDLVPERIEIIRNNRNQPCGECIIEFQDDIEAEKSFVKNNSLLAGRRCRMETVPVNIVAEKLDDDSLRIGNDNNNGFLSNMFGHNRDNNNMYQNQQNDNFRNNNNNNAYRQNRGDDGPRGIGDLDNFDNRNNNRVGGGGNNNRPSRFSDNDGSNSGGRMMGGGVNNFNMNIRRGGNTDGNSMPPINNASIDQFGQPGSVVGLKNVPYKAGTEDILDFFGNFKLGPQNVIRRYNDDGAPTGDARVAFNSPMEARAACEQMRNSKIFNRQVYLSIV